MEMGNTLARNGATWAYKGHAFKLDSGGTLYQDGRAIAQAVAPVQSVRPRQLGSALTDFDRSLQGASHREYLDYERIDEPGYDDTGESIYDSMNGLGRFRFKRLLKTVAIGAAVVGAGYFAGPALLKYGSSALAVFKRKPGGGGEPVGAPGTPVPSGAPAEAGYQVASFATDALRAYGNYQAAKAQGAAPPIPQTDIPGDGEGPIPDMTRMSSRPGLPAWAIPVGIGAAVLLLTLTLSRKGR